MSNAGSGLGGPRGRVITFTGKSRATAQTGHKLPIFLIRGQCDPHGMIGTELMELAGEPLTILELTPI